MDDESLPTCPLCFEIFADPRLFSCGHSICFACVYKMPLTGSQILCPMCKQATVCGQNKQLPKNYSLIEMIEKMKHEQSSFSKKSACTQHTDQKVDLFCGECKVHVCAKCLLLGPHKGHQHISEQDYMETEKLTTTLNTKKLLLKEYIIDCKKQLEDSESFSTKLSELQTLSTERQNGLTSLCTFLEERLSSFEEQAVVGGGTPSIDVLQKLQEEANSLTNEVSSRKESLQATYTTLLAVLNKCCVLYLPHPPAPAISPPLASTSSSVSLPSPHSVSTSINTNVNNNNNNNSSSSNSSNRNQQPPQRGGAQRRGALYVVGGFNTHALATVEEYIIERGTWEEFAPMRTKRSSVAAAVFQGQLYAIGGNDENTNSLATVERYNERLGRWEEGMAMTSKRSGLAVAVLHDRLYALGGYDGLKVLSSVDGYDQSINRWIHVPAMKQSRNFLASAVLNDSFYALGGSDGTNRLNTVERFDHALQRWSAVAPMVNKRSGLSATVLNGYIYALGGFDGTNRLNSVEIYYPSMDKWVEVSSMVARRTWLGATTHGGCIYVVGGFDGANRLTSVERYDPRIDRWDVISDILYPRSGMGVAALE